MNTEQCSPGRQLFPLYESQKEDKMMIEQQMTVGNTVYSYIYSPHPAIMKWKYMLPDASWLCKPATFISYGSREITSLNETGENIDISIDKKSLLHR